MATPTRFPGGITNAGADTLLANMGQLAPTKFITYFEDCVCPPTTAGTFTAVDGEGGLVTIATTKQIGTTKASFKLYTTKQFFFECRASLDDVTKTLVMGFSDSFASHAHGVALDITNTTLTLKIDGTSSTATISNTNNVMFTAGFSYIPGKGVTVFFNGTPVLRAKPNALDPDLCYAGVYVSGATATVDYVLGAIER